MLSKKSGILRKKMKRVRFNAIPGCVGKYVSNIELVLSHPDIEVLKHELRADNTGAAWKQNRAKESRGFYQGKRNELLARNTPEDDPLLIETTEKLAALDHEISELEGQLVELFYIENADGTLSVPGGFWYLCERIEGDKQYNTELTYYKLPCLRDYQSEALDKLYTYRRGTIELATGLGKSKMIISAALSGVKAKKRVMIVVPTEYLVGQMYKEVSALHSNTTAIGGDYKHPKLGWDIMVITMASAPKFVDMATMLIIDEGHHSPATTWAELLSSAIDATHVYNFTATAFRSDGLDLGIHAFGGPIVYTKGARWGIENGWLSPLQVVQIRITPRQNDGGRVYTSPYASPQTVYKQLMAQDNVLQLILDKTLVALGKSRREMLVFKTVKMAEYFQRFAKDKLKFSVAHADKAKTKNPKFPLHQFSRGETDLLVCCINLIAEGIDISSSDVMIVATQHAGDISTYQLVGRILRKSEGKTKAVLIDIAVKGYDLFESAAKKRLAVYKNITDNILEIDL